MSQSNVGWVSDSVTQQVHEQILKHCGGAEMSVTRPTLLFKETKDA